LLNSETDFRSAANFTVVLTAAGMTGAFEGATYETAFQGKTIRATGKVVLFSGAPQIQIADAKQLVVVE
jgi:DNA/RNA endonuclease YhcR with UshA esterase domain